jgi:hypothetical protein
MTYQEFYNEIENVIKNKPEYYRKGQAIFNYIDQKYNVARIVQFKYGVDCFYDDEKIDDFINQSYKIIQSKEND